ncbi:hypothetical protein RB600_008265 [Gaeumannomyces tritici]
MGGLHFNQSMRCIDSPFSSMRPALEPAHDPHSCCAGIKRAGVIAQTTIGVGILSTSSQPATPVNRPPRRSHPYTSDAPNRHGQQPRKAHGQGARAAIPIQREDHLPQAIEPRQDGRAEPGQLRVPVCRDGDLCTTAHHQHPRPGEAGHPIGIKLLDLLLYREPAKTQARPLNIIALLHLIQRNVWTHLFGRQADRLERSSDADRPDEYMIVDNEPLVNAYISVPKDMSQLNCAAFSAGVIEGICDGAGFPARVTAHTTGSAEELEMWPGRTVFLVKFASEVVERENYLPKS